MVDVVPDEILNSVTNQMLGNVPINEFSISDGCDAIAIRDITKEPPLMMLVQKKQELYLTNQFPVSQISLGPIAVKMGSEKSLVFVRESNAVGGETIGIFDTNGNRVDSFPVIGDAVFSDDYASVVSFEKSYKFQLDRGTKLHGQIYAIHERKSYDFLLDIEKLLDR